MDRNLEHNECRYRRYCTNNGWEVCKRGYDMHRYLECRDFRDISYETKEFKKFRKALKENGIHVEQCR